MLAALTGEFCLPSARSDRLLKQDRELNLGSSIVTTYQISVNINYCCDSRRHPIVETKESIWHTGNASQHPNKDTAFRICHLFSVVAVQSAPISVNSGRQCKIAPADFDCFSSNVLDEHFADADRRIILCLSPKTRWKGICNERNRLFVEREYYWRFANPTNDVRDGMVF